MKPWLSESGIFGAGESQTNMQNSSAQKPHAQDVVTLGANGDVISKGKGDEALGATTTEQLAEKDK